MRKVNYLTLILFVLLAGALPARAAEILIDDFTGGLRPGWQEKVFKGRTIYEPAVDEGRNCLHATSNGAASGLYYQIDYDPRQYPILAWSWKVTRLVAGGDERYKDTDDYAARVYVVFPSIFFWNTRTVCYIWANRLPKGEAAPSPYTNNAVLIAVESGPELAGKWLTEQRNIAEDYRRFFGSPPGHAGAIAIMTDADNTGQSAEACYGPIRIRSLEQP